MAVVLHCDWMAWTEFAGAGMLCSLRGRMNGARDHLDPLRDGVEQSAGVVDVLNDGIAAMSSKRPLNHRFRRRGNRCIISPKWEWGCSRARRELSCCKHWRGI